MFFAADGLIPKVMAKVGFLEGYFYDQDRTDWSGASPRPLQYTGWYPPNTDGDSQESAPEILIGPPDQALFIMGYAVAGAGLLSSATPRVRAVFACAPAPTVRAFTDESLASISVPVSILCGGDDHEAPYTECSCWLADRISDATLTSIGSDTGHYVFLCEPTQLGRELEPDICVDAPGVERRAIHDLAAETALRLFEQTPATSKR